MLNAGFATLDNLKHRLLPPAQWEETTWDLALGKLGLSLAGRMQEHANRDFCYGTKADEFTARNYTVTLTTYPVEVITSIQLRSTDGTLAAMDASYSLDKSSGVLSFFSPPGDDTQRLVISYTGGFYLDEFRAPEVTAPQLPDDLLEAWIAEVQRHAESRSLFDAIALRPAKEADKNPLVNGLTPQCVEALRPYRRFAGA
ncbi:MAG: hypothetical protein ABIT37_05860 [Luteolibacter sp.]